MGDLEFDLSRSVPVSCMLHVVCMQWSIMYNNYMFKHVKYVKTCNNS